MAAGEYSVQGVVILSGNWIELVIVTSRARHRQAERPPRHHVDAIVDDVVLIVKKSPPKRKKPERGQRALIPACVDLIGRQLFDQKPIVRLVLIEGAHDIIAISPGKG